MDDLDDVVGEFLVESLENLDQLDQGIVQLEADPTSPELLATIFRSIHTVKGTSSFFGFSHLESVSHAGECLLSTLRDGTLLFTPAHASALLQMCDAIRAMLAAIEATGADGDDGYAAIVDRVTAMANGSDDGNGDVGGEADAVAEMVALADAVAAAEAPSDVAPAPQTGEIDETATAPGSSGGAADTSIRVDVKLLDTLMNLVGELVLARNQVLQFQTTAGRPELPAPPPSGSTSSPPSCRKRS